MDQIVSPRSNVSSGRAQRRMLLQCCKRFAAHAHWRNLTVMGRHKAADGACSFIEAPLNCSSLESPWPRVLGQAIYLGR